MITVTLVLNFALPNMWEVQRGISLTTVEKTRWCLFFAKGCKRGLNRLFRWVRVFNYSQSIIFFVLTNMCQVQRGSRSTTEDETRELHFTCWCSTCVCVRGIWDLHAQ